MNKSERGYRSGDETSPRPLSGVPTILLATVALASPMAIGGVHAVTAAAVAALALAGLWWDFFEGSTTAGRTTTYALSIPAVGFAVLALLCLVQLIPVPTSIYRVIQPTGYAALVADWEVAFGQAPPHRWHLLSLDPRQTTAHALRWIALAATSALAAQIIIRRSGRRRWLGILLFTGVVVAVAGTIQHISETTKILGLYEAQISARSISPFVSTNHAASYYGLMALVGAAYGLDHLRRSPFRATLGAGAATAGLLLSAAHGSDGASLAVVVGMGILGIAVVTRLAPRQLDSRDRWRLVVLGVVFFAAVVALFVPQDWTVSQEESVFEETSAEVRIDMARSALKASRHFPVVGSGAGSLERAIPPYVDWHFQGPASMPTVENEPAEWAMTLGPWATLLAIFLFGLVVFRTAPHVFRARGRRGSAMACAIVVFMGIIAQFHFPFAILGIAIVAVIAVEACLDRRRDPLFFFGKRRAIFLFILALTIAVTGLLVARATVLAPGAEATLEVTDEEELRRSIHLYPTDGVLFSAMSLEARRAGDHRRALELARRAFELRPHPQQQFLLAASLANNSLNEEAARVYGDLFSAERRRRGSIYRWTQHRLRHDLPTPALRGQAMADAHPTDISRFARRLRADEGNLAAIDFALALVEERPDSAHAHLLLIDEYRRADQDELAEMYARMLVSRDLEAPDGERPAGLSFLLDHLRRDGRSSEAQLIAQRAFDSGRASPELGRQVLTLRPADPDDLAPHRLELFEQALDIGCTPPYDEDHRKICWEGHAYFAELSGQIDEATSHLRRVVRHFDDPRPLGGLFARQGQCRELAGLRREFTGSRYERALDRQAADCARRTE